MPKWTADQASAINADGGTLLVTAAAGSGKTSVLTQRIIRLITEKNTDIDRLLVVTFTRAAASEMKERVSSRLSELIAENPANRNLTRQQMLLNRANISTIDSFCASLIRENFRLAGVDCDFRVIEESEYKLIRAEVLDSLLEKKYSEKEEGFLKLADMLASDRNDKDLRDCIQHLFKFLSSNDNREGWLDKIEAGYSEKSGIELWENEVISAVKEELSYCMLLTEAALEDAESVEEIANGYSAALKSDMQYYAAMYEKAENGDIEGVANAADFTYERFKNVKTEYTDIKERVKERRTRAKDKTAALRKSLLCYTKEKIAADTRQIRPAVLALVRLMREYLSALDGEKRELNVLSFDDLEQLTISLLVSRNEGSEPAFTPLAEEVSRRFDAILVDEYQDTNPAQSLIYRALSKNGENLFMVGDIKQAIYSFRNASPEDFAAKKEEYGLYDPETNAFPARVALSANFRSRKGITDFVNFLFEKICTKALGGTDYDETERLYPLGEFPEKEGDTADTELYFFDASDSQEVNSGEAEFIAERVCRLLEENIRVPLKEGGTRPLRYGDIAVISRSGKKLALPLRTALDKYQIPMSAPSEESFLDIYEVSTAISLLKIIDNPYQDVPLAAVMLSPLFGFTPDELALMRMENRSIQMYDALRLYAKTACDTKSEGFLATVDSLRKDAAVMSVPELLLKIYASLSLPALLSAGRKGTQVKSNLDRLVSLADGLTSIGNRNVAGFLRHVDRIGETGNTLESPDTVAEDGVRLMTVHKSKGLEFPVVFLAGNGSFNTEDSKNRYLVHGKLGFGGRIKEGNTYYSTVQRDIISRRIRKEQTSEELRILYVALTRASQKLIICSSVNQPESKLSACSDLKKHTQLLQAEAARAVSFSDWLLPIATVLEEMTGEKPYLSVTQNGEMPKLPDSAGAANSILQKQEQSSDSQIRRFEESFDKSIFVRSYPFEKDLSLPTKLSASGISHEGFTHSAFSVKPVFAEEGIKLRGAEAGTAVHLFMSLLDFTSGQSIAAQLERLCSENKLTRKQADSVDTDACEILMKNALGMRITEAARQNSLLREYGFSFRVNAREIPGFSEHDGKILVSGTADLIFFENGSPVIVDFKTDRVKKEEELIKRYALQLKLYCFAAEALWGKKASAYIWSFALNRGIALDF